MESEINEIMERAKRDLLAAASKPERAVAFVPLTPDEEERVRELRRVAALEYMTRDEAAIYLNVSTRTVDEMVRVGLPYVELPTSPTALRKPKRFRRVSIDRWLESGGRLRRAG